MRSIVRWFSLAVPLLALLSCSDDPRSTSGEEPNAGDDGGTNAERAADSSFAIATSLGNTAHREHGRGLVPGLDAPLERERGTRGAPAFELTGGDPTLESLVTGEQAKLTSTDPTRLFGSVSLDQATAVVGAPFMSNGDPGAAYVFVRSGATWSQQAKLTANDGGMLDAFGSSVSAEGDTVVVGAPNIANSTGAAYVFVRSGATWSQQAKLVASNGGAGALFGYATSLSGDTALVGAYGAATRTGAAYVFTRSGAVWSQQAILTASDASRGNVFGSAVSISADTALVGAYGAASSAGVAYVFLRNGASWSQQARLTAGDATRGDIFGYATALSSETALIGAYGASRSTGAAYVFVRSGGSWAQQAKVVASDGAAGDDYGSSVDIMGDVALVGAYGVSSGTGAAYLLTRSGATWSESAKLTGSDAVASDNVGRSSAMSGNSVLLGAPTRRVGYPGAAYLYTFGQGPGDACASGADCASGYCADAVCCDTACNGGICDACSVAAGATADGTCTPFNGTACNDGNGNTICIAGACTGFDHCLGVVCAAQDQCHVAGTCIDHLTGTCGNPAATDGTSCNDGNPSTTGDVCTAGACAGIDHCSGVVCTAQDQCHVAGSCIDHATGICGNPAAADGTVCDDGNSNTSGDVCAAGFCGGGDHCIGVVCVALDQCHVAGACVNHASGACSNPTASDGTGCNDGNPSTVSDVCVSGACAGVDACLGAACIAYDECHVPGFCIDHAFGACSNPSAADGTTCSLGTCQLGTCTPPTPPVDAGTPSVDAGTPPVDAGNGPVDAGNSPIDAGNPSDDAGGAPVDAGNAAVDAGNASDDAGAAQLDAGNAPVDAGNAALDAGRTMFDAGDARVDAGDSPVDAGNGLLDAGDPSVVGGGPQGGGDAASIAPPQVIIVEVEPQGCSCRTTGAARDSTSGTLTIFGIALWLLRRRKRARETGRRSTRQDQSQDRADEQDRA